LVHADNDERHIVGERAVSERGHAIENVLLHFGRGVIEPSFSGGGLLTR
jgi:hypothetical protein